MKMRFTVRYPQHGRIIYFEGKPTFCGEYNTLCFNMAENSKTIEYQHLAGSSFIPSNEKG